MNTLSPLRLPFANTRGIDPTVPRQIVRRSIHVRNHLFPRTLCLAGTLVLCSGAEPLLTHTDVFISGRDGYHTYRIPAIEVAPDGSLIAFAEARKYSTADPGFGMQDIDLAYKRSTNNGATWSPMTVLEEYKGTGH